MSTAGNVERESKLQAGQRVLPVLQMSVCREMCVSKEEGLVLGPAGAFPLGLADL